MKNKLEIIELISQFDPKIAKRMNLETIIKMMEKLEEHSINDLKIDLMTQEIKNILIESLKVKKFQKKEFRMVRHNLTGYVRKEYGLVPAEYYLYLYFPFGLVLGAGIGVPLMIAVNVVFLAVFIGAGVTISIAIGSSLDNEAKKEGRVY